MEISVGLCTFWGLVVGLGLAGGGVSGSICVSGYLNTYVGNTWVWYRYESSWRFVSVSPYLSNIGVFASGRMNE